jgi:peptide/nickel transport system substrate-binding protein
MPNRLLLSATVLAAFLTTALSIQPVSAKTLRWANDGDVNSMDPYARNEVFLVSFMGNVYEPLVRRNRDMEPEPALAVAWAQTAPTVWRFDLRRNVRFHDGSPFDADDVMFSFERARAPGSNIPAMLSGIKEARKIDDYTVEFVTHGPDPILVREIANWFIMDREWAEKNNAMKPADLTKNEETFATRNANGTGPFILKERQPDVRTVLVSNPDWWDKPEHNLTEAVFSRIAHDPTRVAALLSGEIDMIYTVPPQDADRIARTAGLRIVQRPELRVLFLGFDQLRDELLESGVKGKNPFKDRRVRQAFYQAIDVETIRTKIMRGAASPVGSMIGEGVSGFDKALNERYPYDPGAAKKLLTEAGYPNGFDVGMDCPNDRYVNDEAICRAAAGMLAQIGITVNLNAQTRAKYFAKILGPAHNTSFYMLGWTPITGDAHDSLLNLLASRGPASHGLFNVGGYSNARVDELVDAIRGELDPDKRTSMIHEALRIHKEEFGHIPLHQQTVVWAVRDNVELVQQPDNFFPLRFVTMK